MEEDLKKFIEKLKENDSDIQKTKEYILIIKKYLDRYLECCDEDFSKEEAFEDFLKEYDENLKVDTNEVRKLAYMFVQYNSYKELIKLSKSNKLKFKKIVTDSKSKERENSKEELYISPEIEKQLVISMRQILRKYPKVSEKELMLIMQKRKSELGDALKDIMIKSINKNVEYLDEYGLLDNYIKEVNDNLEQLNLEGIKLERRNALCEIGDGKGNFMKYDENGVFRKYDINGNIVKDGEDIDKYEEDIGVIDTFEKEYLKKLSPEDLLMMDTFYRSKYFEERLGISKAIAVIKYLNLWPDMIEKSEEFIEKIDANSIKNALKRDLALTYLYKNEKNLTLKMKNQYYKFLRISNMEKRGKLREELQEVKGEFENLANASNNIALESCLMIEKLKEKDFSVKDWGTLEFEDDNKEPDNIKEIVFAIENSNFRGPLIMAIPEKALQSFFDVQNLKFPEYKNGNKINEKYSGVMAKLYLPTSSYFTKYIKKKYDEDPSSELYAALAGKKVKKLEKEGQELE